jgi:ABC-2 type transport system permease protein
MSLQQDTAGAQPATAAKAHRVRPFAWSLRRELWEHRALYFAPAIVSILALLGLIAVAFKLPPSMAGFDSFPPQQQVEILSAPYAAIAMVLMVTATIVALFYCLDALYGERRDRSALFWKSMPVSDWTTVLSKFAVPMLVLPIGLFALITVTQIVVLLGHVGLWAVRGHSVSNLLLQLPLLDMPLGVAHFLVTLAIWYAPIYAWLLLVSAWAQRSPFVWAVVPWVAAVVFERAMLGSTRLLGWLSQRFFGHFDAAFTTRETMEEVVSRLQQSGAAATSVVRNGSDHVPDVMRFLGTPSVWIGLLAAALLIAATVWLRRRQEAQSS